MDDGEKKKIIEKIKKVNPKAVDVKVDDKGNATLIYADGSTNFIPAKKLIYKLARKVSKEDASGPFRMKRGARNPKTDISSLGGVVATLVTAATGLLVTNKKMKDENLF